MGVSLEEYEFEYSVFIAEQELIETLTNISSSYVMNESVGLVYIEETVKDTVMQYLGKITTALEKAYATILGIITTGPAQPYLKAIEGKITNPNPNFTVGKYTTCDFNKLQSIHIQPMNYEAMKEDLTSVDDFMKKYYNMLPEVQEGGTKARVEKYVYTVTDNVKADAKMITSAYEFCKTGAKNEITKIKDDIGKVNQSNQAIAQMANTLKESALFLEAIEKQDIEKPKEDQNNDQNQGEGADNQQNKDGAKSMLKSVNVYMTASMQILTAKMNIIKDLFRTRLEILKTYIPVSSVLKKNPNTGKEEPVVQQQTQTKQVDITANV